MNSRRQDLVVVLDALELGEARPVGVLTRWPGAILSVAFEYARSWLDDVGRNFPIDPALPLSEAQYIVPGRRVPGIFADTAPDKWGEALMVRREGRDLDAWEFMTGVADDTRMGALRLRRGVEGPFIADREPTVPPFTRLRELQEMARRFEDDPNSIAADQIALLVAPGSSLGGARPKANYVAPDGSLWIAKFPSSTDRRDVAAWEHVYANLARLAGIEVAETELVERRWANAHVCDPPLRPNARREKALRVCRDHDWPDGHARRRLHRHRRGDHRPRRARPCPRGPHAALPANDLQRARG